MDIKDFHAIIECYETRSINKAAKTLYITPQGLGKLLDRVEHELQVKLFERTKQGLMPTESGTFFYEKSLGIISKAHELEAGLEVIKNKSKVFKVGYSCGLIRMLPLVKVEQFQEKLSNTKLVLEEGPNDEIKNALIMGKLDIALVIGRIAGSDFIEEELASKTMCAVVPKNHPLYSRSSIKIADLKAEQLICLNEKYQSYRNLASSCEREGFYPNIRIKTMEASMIYEFVAEGLGLGIDVDIHNKKSISDDIKLIPIEDAINWNVYVAYEKTKAGDKHVKAFLDMIR
ncbi:MAG: LysR family transcriptional regulator [Pseudobutyrivibrio ruminis]|nr:LysR family transcriptional regulator [Pseudobutyrivibrio ruminis]